jgi:predicted nucleic acid-binding protein
MPVLIDTQVFVQIASGNKQAADALLKRLASGDPVYISTVSKNELIMQSKGGLGPQYEKLLDDLKIKVAPATNMADRIDFHADNINMGKIPRKIPAKDIVNLHGNVSQYKVDPATGNLRPTDAFVASEAKAMKAELWTYDTDFRIRAEKLGVNIAEESKTIKMVPQAEDAMVARRLLGLEAAGSGGKAFLQALRSTAYWKAVGNNFLEGMKYGLNPEAIAGEVPFLVLHFADRAAARDAILKITVKFLKEGFRKGVAAGIARWTEEDVASNLFNSVTEFRLQDLGDPGGYLDRSFIFHLAQYKENYAIVVGYNYAGSKSPDWKWKLYNQGVDKLKQQRYFFATDQEYYDRFIDSLAYVLRGTIDPIADHAIQLSILNLQSQRKIDPATAYSFRQSVR